MALVLLIVAFLLGATLVNYYKGPPVGGDRAPDSTSASGTQTK